MGTEVSIGIAFKETFIKFNVFVSPSMVCGL